MEFIMLDKETFTDIYRGYIESLILEGDGVDNWEWYMESADDYIRDCGLDPQEYHFCDAIDVEVEKIFKRGSIN